MKAMKAMKAGPVRKKRPQTKLAHLEKAGNRLNKKMEFLEAKRRCYQKEFDRLQKLFVKNKAMALHQS